MYGTLSTSLFCLAQAVIVSGKVIMRNRILGIELNALPQLSDGTFPFLLLFEQGSEFKMGIGEAIVERDGLSKKSFCSN